MIQRDIAKEQAALKTFGENQGKMPSSAEDWKLLHQYAYGANLPDEFKEAQNQAAPSAGVTPTITPPSTTGFNPNADIGTLAGQVEQAGADVSKFSSPTMATNILQEAIREKTGVAQAGIGESEIFKKAGISGYAPLAQSLNTRGDELAINQAAFQNIITSMAGNYRDMATNAFNKYSLAMDNYNTKKNELLEAEKSARDFAQTIELYKIKSDIDKDLMEYEALLKTELLAEQPQLNDIQVKKIEGSAEAKKLLALKDLKNKLTAYRAEAAKSEGFDVVGSRKSILDSMYADLKIAYKEAANLGALTGPDVAIISEAIKPIAGIQNLAGYLTGGRQQGVLDSIDTALNSVNTQAKTNYDSLISKWGEYEDDPYIQNLKEGFDIEEVQKGYSSQINTARSQGYSPDEIINYMRSTMPELRQPIEEAKSNGYNSNEIIQFLESGGDFNKDLTVSLNQSFPQGSTGGQCTTWLHKVADFPHIGDGKNDKIASVQKYGFTFDEQPPKIGDIIVTNENKTYGHTAMIISINPDGTATLAESNYAAPNKVTYTRKISLSSPKIYGAIRPTKIKTLA